MQHEHNHQCDGPHVEPSESWTAVRVGVVLLAIMLVLIWRFT